MFFIRRGIYNARIMLGYFMRQFEYLRIVFDRRGHLDNHVCSVGGLFMLFKQHVIRVVCYNECVAHEVGQYECLGDMFDDRYRIIQRGAEIDAVRDNFRRAQYVYDDERWKMERFFKIMSCIE
jgi:hypothetical protein